jgi:hypothetical protein
MTLEEQLRHSFDRLASRLRDEVVSHAGTAIDEIAATAENERAEAVAEAARDAWASAQREGETRLTAAVAEAEKQVRAVAELTAVASRARLLDAVRAMDRAGSLTGILDVLVTAACAEIGRAALLLKEGAEFRSWRAEGFGAARTGAASDETNWGVITSTLADGGIVTDAAETGNAAHVPGSSASTPVFAALPVGQPATAVPLRMGGQVFAVLYADAGNPANGDGSEAWRSDGAGTTGAGEVDGFMSRAAVVEILARHASQCLEAATASRLAQVGAGA